MISTIRVIRIAQIYSMTRHLPDLQILVETMKASVAELKLWLGTFVLISILFATLIYYAERKEINSFITKSDVRHLTLVSCVESLTIPLTTSSPSLTPSGGRW